MYQSGDTIYALASGLGTAGIAVIRLSGPDVLKVLKNLCGLENPKPNYAYFRSLIFQDKVLDKGLVLYFKAPHSFTGEDVAELQIHGGRGVIQSVMNALSQMPNCRPAERGEYSRRAVINGKMDLTEAEGLLDLIHAETEEQRKQALAQLSGNLGQLYESWRKQLVHHLAYAEAFIDFPEEEISVTVSAVASSLFPVPSADMMGMLRETAVQIRSSLCVTKSIASTIKSGECENNSSLVSAL